MKRRMRQWISAVMFLSVIIVNASTVLASEPEYQVPSAVNEEEIVEETGPIEEAAVTEEIMPREDASTEETVSEENTDLISENDMGLTANSWRYQNGQPIYNSASEGRILSSEPYHENATRKGIDVSQWQGEIDWEKVKASGIDYAIIRCGWGMNDEGQDDPMWLRNVSECERLGFLLVYISILMQRIQKEQKVRQNMFFVWCRDIGFHIRFFMIWKIEQQRLSAMIRWQTSQILFVQ